MNQMTFRSRCAHAALLLFTLPLTASVFAQDVNPQDIHPDQIVTAASYNELHARDTHPYRYTLRKVDNGRITTKEIIETKDGDVARLIAMGDQPLTPEREAIEIQRLQALLAHPEIQAHRQKREQADANRANEMIRLLPNAFVYSFDGMVDGPNGPCYRLSLKPNPDFVPPDIDARVYRGMAGELWIDQKQERMVRLDVHLTDNVEFGWGIVGRLYKGGTILIEQKDVGQGHWEQTLLRLNLRGTILMFKSLVINTTETESNFSPVPADWTYQDAVRTLLSEQH